MRILVTATLDEWGIETLSRYGQVSYQGFGEKKRLLAGRKPKLGECEVRHSMELAPNETNSSSPVLERI